MSEGVTYAVDVVFRGKDQGTKKSLDDIAGYANKAKRQTMDFTKSLAYKRDALKATNQHLAITRKRTLDFSGALHGTMARNRADQIKRWFGSLRDGARGAQSPLSGLTGALGGIAAGAGLFGALALGKSAFLDFNNTVEMSTISLAAQEKMLLGGSWSSAMKNATGLFEDYQKVAATSIGSTTDYLDMHKGIASAAYQAGIGAKQLKEMTIGATIGAIALGERADMVALDIKQMLAGDVTSRDRTAQILLASQGVSQSKFNAMQAKDRNKVIMAGLNDPALKAAAKAYGNTYAGALSAFEDNLKITLGKVGKPLFQAITKEVQRWNAWVEKNPEKIQRFATEFKNALMEGFRAVKDAMSWIVDNKSLLLKLAEAALVMKGAGMVGGLLKGAAGMGPMGGIGRGATAAGLGQYLGLDPLANAAQSAAAALGGFGVVLSGVTLGAKWAANKLDEAQDADIARVTDMGVLRGNLARMGLSGFRSDFLGISGQGTDAALLGAKAAMRNASDMGLVRGGKVDRWAAYKSLYGDTVMGRAMMTTGSPEGERLIAELTKAIEMLREPNMWVALAQSQAFMTHGLLAQVAPMLPTDAKKDPAKGKTDINVNVKQEITSDDPDRLAGDLRTATMRAFRSRRSARDVEPQAR